MPCGELKSLQSHPFCRLVSNPAHHMRMLPARHSWAGLFGLLLLIIAGESQLRHCARKQLLHFCGCSGASSTHEQAVCLQGQGLVVGSHMYACMPCMLRKPGLACVTPTTRCGLA